MAWWRKKAGPSVGEQWDAMVRAQGELLLFTAWCRAQMRLQHEQWRSDMSKLTDALARLQADVAKNTSLTESIIQQNKGLADQLRAIASDPTTGDNVAAQLGEFADQLEGTANEMSAAIQANTAPPTAPATVTDAPPAQPPTPPATATDTPAS